MRGEVTGIECPPSAASLQNVNMNDERSSKTNKLSNRDLGAGALEESLRGALFQLQFQPRSPRGLQSSMKQIAAGVAASRTPGTSGRRPQKHALTHLELRIT